MASPFLPDTTFKADNVINASERAGDPTDDEGKLAQLESNGRLSNEFIKQYESTTTTSFSSALTPDYDAGAIYQATRQDHDFTLNAPTNLNVGETLTVTLSMKSAKTFTASADYFFIDATPTNLDQDYTYNFYIKKTPNSNYSISWERYFYYPRTMEFVGSAVNAVGGLAATMSLTSLTGGVASAPAEGDMVIVLVGNPYQETVAINTAGYTQIGTQVNGNDINDCALGVFYKIMGSTPDTTVEYDTGRADANRGAALVYVWRGFDETTEFDVTATSDSGGNTNRGPNPDITPVTNGSAIILTAVGADANALTSPPSGFTNPEDVRTVSLPTVTLMAASKIWLSTDGTVNPNIWTTQNTSSDDSWGGITIALRPRFE